MLSNLTSNANQMAETLNMSRFFRDSLLGAEQKPDDIMTRAADQDNQSLVGFQLEIMKGM